MSPDIIRQPAGRSIIVETKEQAGMVEHVRLSRKTWLNADKTEVVEEGSPEAAFLYGSEGHLVPRKEAEDLGADYQDANIDPRDANRTDYVVVEEAQQAEGQPVVEGQGRSTKPVEPGRETEASSTMRTQDKATKAVTAEEAAKEQEEQRKQQIRAANKQRQSAANKQSSQEGESK